MLYTVKADDTNYMMLTYSNDYKFKSITAVRTGGITLIANGTPHNLLDDWEEIEVVFVDGYPENRKDKHMPDIAFITGRLFLTDKTKNFLSDVLNKVEGEYLPVRYNGNQKGFIFNPQCIVEANTKLSIRDGNNEITSIVFDQENLLFKTEFDNYLGLFCNGEFRKIIEDNNLKGLCFSSDLSCYQLQDETSQPPYSH